MNSITELEERMLKNRIVFLGLPIDEYVAQMIVTHLVYLQTTDRNAHVKLIVNSPGGIVSAGLTIIDTMTSLQPPVRTHCLGRADSMAAIIMSQGARGHRTAAPHARFSLGPVWSSTPDDETVHDLDHYTRVLTEMVARNTGRPIDQVKKECERTTHLTASDALAYGLIDEITDKIPG